MKDGSSDRGLIFIRFLPEHFSTLAGWFTSEEDVVQWGAAIRAYARVGFRHEGIRRSASKVGAARWYLALTGILRDEWAPG
ncbi:GNAT family N-acetyltransferase [Acetobacter oeni]|uniref:Uncharacterized protein n=1 Tax=Acetobacter oeni TaxID=304077 RepID=A0A511XHM8_9PROT|nr:GNAT family protein [Acetobacter oeni]MBB3881298.1 hypothetical protein [Acetobacter oeni]NHO18173.1 hypothetical protein [Acetobacter oeni]GBR08050.1 hypothetical protein AA21952_2501 [Acetobacter oeni LMG 21952]GEN62453.1 hypothetical protein AOE01nite_06770 [Acetobacter oeni]